ncbi:MAG: 23S rRNA (guanosine(2251)-2'-O)-methyltransferase RlmB [Acidimicrobiia bacterium]|nr:23S rRNA (guanosine(2251)-2'-O)-methyltransferase RlmB [Acidimicrobiia bacterium]
MIIYGINPVREALLAGHVVELRVGPRTDNRMDELIEAARQAGVRVQRLPREALDRQARGGVHQGVVAQLAERPRLRVRDLVAAARSPALFVVLDGVEDPHNVGAVARSAEAAGADGLIRQQRRAAALDGAAAKAAAGALDHLRVADVVNVARAIEDLKEAGIWTIGLAGDAGTSWTAIDFRLPSAIVLGGEGQGLRRLVRERCDRLAAIPMLGRVQSLNVSAAAAVVLFEAVRQRREPAAG